MAMQVRPETPVALMARAPVPGKAKTRLIPRLGATGAARLHAAMTRHALQEIVGSGLSATLWCDPDIDHPFFAECARDFGIALRAQPSGDLGGRMLAIFEAAEGPLLLMGSDCPAIDARFLLTCERLLACHPAVVAPTADGGYGLIGLQVPFSNVFRDMPWGTDAVMAMTRRRLLNGNVDLAETSEIWDVDTPDDLTRLAATGFVIPPYED